MNFLAPLFLLGALAVAAPLIFHLIRRTTREVTPFSSLMFLQPTPPRVTRRSRIENLWLLLLRCLVILLLAIGFSRPFLQEKIAALPSEGAGTRTVILVDTSASMRREGMWDEAKRTVGELLAKAEPADEIALLAFDRRVQSLVGFKEWTSSLPADRASLASQRLSAVSPSWGGTHLDAALLEAAGLFAVEGEERGPARRIVVVSDLQDGARVDALQGYKWPRGVEVVLQPLVAREVENASVHWVAEANEAEAAKGHRLRVQNSAEAKSERFELRAEGSAAAGAKLEVYVPAGQSRIARAPQPDPQASSTLVLSGDRVSFDNTIHLLPPRTPKIPVLFIGQDGDEDPRGSLYYLRRAFPKTRQQNVEITAQRSAQPVPPAALLEAQLLVIGDAVPPQVLASLRPAIREGKTAVLPLTSVASGETLKGLLEIGSVSVTEETVKDYSLLGQIDFQHPLFASFADPRFSDFTKIHFWKHRRLEHSGIAGARVLASFDSGAAAIVQIPSGKGSVVIFTSSWRPLDSQLALSSKFVPLLHTLLEQSSNLPTAKAQYFVGDEVALPPGSDSTTVRKPDGSSVALSASGRFSETDLPGIYTVTPGDVRFAVNLPPEESRLVPLPEARFAALEVPLHHPSSETPAARAEREAIAEATQLEGRQKLWRWLILIALAGLLLETLLAARLSAAARSSTVPQL
ncbi:MAG TPA: BatA domain-containing protein [Chthoniobacteraceae bacterium]|jgi:Mg-chelatase subunit ChlD